MKKRIISLVIVSVVAIVGIWTSIPCENAPMLSCNTYKDLLFYRY